MKRMGMVIGIKPEHIAEYKRTHAAVWPEVLASVSRHLGARNRMQQNQSLRLSHDI